MYGVGDSNPTELTQAASTGNDSNILRTMTRGSPPEILLHQDTIEDVSLAWGSRWTLQLGCP